MSDKVKTRRSFLGDLIAIASGVVVMASTLLDGKRAAAQVTVKYGVPTDDEKKKEKERKKKKDEKRKDEKKKDEKKKVAPKYGPPLRPKYGVPDSDKGGGAGKYAPKYGVPVD